MKVIDVIIARVVYGSCELVEFIEEDVVTRLNKKAVKIKKNITRGVI